MSIDDLLCMYGLREGTEVERIQQLIMELSRERAIRAIYDLVLMPHQQTQIAYGIKNLVDS